MQRKTLALNNIEQFFGLDQNLEPLMRFRLRWWRLGNDALQLVRRDPHLLADAPDTNTNEHKLKTENGAKLELVASFTT